MQLEGMLHVEERLGTEEQEHVAACCRDASRQAARPVGTQRQSRKAASVFCDLLRNASAAGQYVETQAYTLCSRSRGTKPCPERNESSTP